MFKFIKNIFNQKEKVRQSKLGKKASLETKQKLSILRTGEGNVMFGKIHKLETKEKIREKAKGRKQSKETVEKRKIKLIGKKRTEESCKNISKALKGIKKTPEHIKNLKESFKKNKVSVMGNNPRAVKIFYNKKNYSCKKELWIELFNFFPYSTFIVKYKKGEII